MCGHAHACAQSAWPAGHRAGRGLGLGGGGQGLGLAGSGEGRAGCRPNIKHYMHPCLRSCSRAAMAWRCLRTGRRACWRSTRVLRCCLRRRALRCVVGAAANRGVCVVGRRGAHIMPCHAVPCGAMAHVMPWRMRCHGACHAMAHAMPWRMRCHGACDATALAMPWRMRCHGACDATAHAMPWRMRCHGACDATAHAGHGACDATAHAMPRRMRCHGACDAMPSDVKPFMVPCTCPLLSGWLQLYPCRQTYGRDAHCADANCGL
eukprot:364705-Chlamydomonas_euryale.AAC.25